MDSVTWRHETPVKHRANRTGIKECVGSVTGNRFGSEIIKDLFTDIRKPPIRSSALSCFEHCPRKFLYRYKLGLVLKGDYSPALHAGRVFHLVLQSLFAGAGETKALKAADPYLNRLSKNLMAEADPAGFLPSGKLVEDVLVDLENEYHKARAMAVAFLKFVPFNYSHWEILRTPDGTPCIELLLETKVPGISTPLVAPCDLALLKKGTTEVWIVDHKSTSQNAMARARSVRISAQIQLYRLVLQSHLNVWAEQESYPDLTVVGSIHNIVKKPGIKFCPKTKDKDGFSAYITRVHAWYQDEHNKDPGNSPILQTATAFTEPILGPELYLRLQQQARASHTDPCLDRFYRGGDYCCSTFNKECIFADLCSTSLATWPDIVARKFEVSHREDEIVEGGS